MGKPKNKRFSRGKKRGGLNKYFELPLIFKNQEAREDFILKRITQIPGVIPDSVMVLSQDRSGILKISYSLKGFGSYQHEFIPYVFNIEIYEKQHDQIMNSLESFLKNVIIMDKIQINQSLLKTINDIIGTKIKGMKSEVCVERLIRELIEQGVFKYDVVITDVMPAGMYTDTHQGIDMHIIAKSSVATVFVPLQVKSSETGQDEHIKKYGHIPSIYINGKKDQQIKDAILLICHTYIYGKTKKEKVLHL